MVVEDIKGVDLALVTDPFVAVRGGVKLATVRAVARRVLYYRGLGWFGLGRSWESLPADVFCETWVYEARVVEGRLNGTTIAPGVDQAGRFKLGVELLSRPVGGRFSVNLDDF